MHFIKQMVKEDFYPHKYDRPFKCDTVGGDGRGEGLVQKRSKEGKEYKNSK